MAVPVVEQIALELLERLESISPNGGYHYKPARVVRPSREDLLPEHLLIVLVQGAPNLSEEIEGSPYRYQWLQPFLLALYIRPPDDSVEPFDAIVNRFRSDVEKAVCTPADWETFGGLAHDAHWGEVTLFDDDGGFRGVILQLDVSYRVAPSDPFTVA